MRGVRTHTVLVVVVLLVVVVVVFLIVVVVVSGANFLLVAHMAHTPHWPMQQPFGMSTQREMQPVSIYSTHIYICTCIYSHGLWCAWTVVHKTIVFKLQTIV